MRVLIACVLLLLASPVAASELVPHKPLPTGVPETFTPGKPEGGGLRYAYPFVKDRYGRLGLMDWCSRFGQDCGKRAADRFCRQVDGGKNPAAASFAPWEDSGQYTATVLIQDGQPCELPRCYAFKYIVCRK